MISLKTIHSYAKQDAFNITYIEDDNINIYEGGKELHPVETPHTLLLILYCSLYCSLFILYLFNKKRIKSNLREETI